MVMGKLLAFSAMMVAPMVPLRVIRTYPSGDDDQVTLLTLSAPAPEAAALTVAVLGAFVLLKSRVWVVRSTSSSLDGASSTVTIQLSDLPPALAVMVTVPEEPTRVTTPLWSTLAIVSSLEVQVTVLLVAYSGTTVAVSWNDVS